MKIIFRVDASNDIGTGHVMRCLTLADILHDGGAEMYFICRELSGNLCDLIEKKGYQVSRLPYGEVPGNKANKIGSHAEWLGVPRKIEEDETSSILKEINKRGVIDLLVVDHYALDGSWESEMRPYAKYIMAIDDLADRRHDCDILLDQNYHINAEDRYDELIPMHCKKLLGPQYALLRREFYEARREIKEKDGKIGRILIFMSGADPNNETQKAIKAVQMLTRSDIAVDVIIGSLNQHREQIKKICAPMLNVSIHCQVDNIAQLMLKADLAIGGGGGTTWERCFLGLPAIVLVLAENQKESVASVAEAGAIWDLGYFKGVRPEHIYKAIKRAIEDPGSVRKMKERAMRLMGDRIINYRDVILSIIMKENKVIA